MRELVWEWLLADGSAVRASLDRKRDEESVWVGKRLVSRAAIGSKPDGHRISASAYRDVDARVVFDPGEELAHRRCSLRRGEDVVTPHTWPGRSRERLRRAAVVGVPIALAASCVAFGVAFAVFVAGTRLETREVDRLAGPLSETPAVGVVTSPPIQVNPAGHVARRKPLFAPRPVTTSRPPAIVARPLPPPRAPDPFTSPPPPRRTTFLSAPRTAPPSVTVDVVCDEQGVCQGVKPVRLAMTR